MAIQKIIKSGLTLGAASLLSVAPVLLSSTPAKAVTADGDLQELEYNTQAAPLLTKGSRGTAVKDVQLFLAEEGYYQGRIDSIYGAMTEKAVREFQEDNDLLADGRIGDDTWSVMVDSPSEPNLSNQEPAALDTTNENFLDNDMGVFEAEDALGNELGSQ